MKRDVDLCRQLLLDIENQGSDCSLSNLRSGIAQDADERIRYHLRLLIDAGFVKEIDRTASGVPCIRLTNSGQEFIELVRSEARWREAKWLIQEQTGGLSLTVLRALLTKWAVEATTRRERMRRNRRVYRRPFYRGEAYRAEPGYYVDSYRFEREPLVEEEDELRLVRSRPDYREKFDFGDEYDREESSYNGFDARYDTPIGVTLPVSVI